MIVSDNDIDPKELDELYRIAKHHYGYSSEEINAAVLSNGTAIYNPETIEEKIMYLYDLALIATADGIIADEELNLLRNYTLKFGFEKENIEHIVNFLIENAKEKVSINEISTKIWD